MKSKVKEDAQKIIDVITKCCKTKSTLDINIFDPIANEADKAMEILGDGFSRHETMQDTCFVTHFNGSNMCGYKSVEICMYRRRKGGEK